MLVPNGRGGASEATPSNFLYVIYFFSNEILYGYKLLNIVNVTCRVGHGITEKV